MKIARPIAAALLAASLAGCQFSFFKDGLNLAAPSQDDERLERAVAVNPSNAHAWFMLGRVRLEEERPPAARAAFSKALKLQPGFEEARLGMGKAWMFEGRWTRAIAEFEKVLAANPNSVSAREGIAAAALEARDVARAEAAARAALALDPASREAARVLAEVVYIRGDYGAASEAWSGAGVGRDGIAEDLRGYVRKYPPANP